MISSVINVVISAIKTKTVKQSGITFAGTIINGLLGMIFFIVVARYLGPEDYGKFSVAITAITLLSSISDIGTNTGIVRFAAGSLESDKSRAYKFLKLGLKIKLIAGLAVVVIGWLILPFVVSSLLHKPELLSILRLALLGVGGMLLFSFSTYSLQALQKYKTWATLNIINNALRLIVVFAVFSVGFITAESPLLVYLIFPFVGFAAGFMFLPKFWKVKNENEILPEFFKYNKWVATFTIIAAFSSRLDTFLLTRLLSFGEVGIYQVAKTLADVVPQIVFALGIVVAPKLSGFNGDNKKAVKYLRKLQLFVIGLAFGGILFGLPFGYLIIPRLYGVEYFASIMPFAMLLVAQALFLISVPVHTAVIYYFSYPKLFVYISLIHMAIIAIGGWTLIPLYGYIGATLVVFMGSLSNFVIPAIWVVRKFKQ